MEEEFETPEEEIHYLNWLIGYYENNAEFLASMLVQVYSSIWSIGLKATSEKLIDQLTEVEEGEGYYNPAKQWLKDMGVALNENAKNELGIKQGDTLGEVLEKMKKANAKEAN